MESRAVVVLVSLLGRAFLLRAERLMVAVKMLDSGLWVRGLVV